MIEYSAEMEMFSYSVMKGMIRWTAAREMTQSKEDLAQILSLVVMVSILLFFMKIKKVT